MSKLNKQYNFYWNREILRKMPLEINGDMRRINQFNETFVSITNILDMYTI